MDSPAVSAINNIIDLFFVFDIIIACRTTIINQKTEEEIVEPKRIFKIYFKTRFWVDLSATIPFDLLIFWFTGEQNKFFQLLGILKLGRVLRLNRIIQDLNIDANLKLILKLLKLCFFLIMYLHCMACAWWLIVIEQGKKWIPIIEYGVLPDDINSYDDIYRSSNLRQYCVSLHAAVLLLAGNDIGPRTTLQVAFGAMNIFMGAIINANIFGELAVLASNLNKAALEF